MSDISVDPNIVLPRDSQLGRDVDAARRALLDLALTPTALADAAAIGRTLADLGRRIELQALGQSESRVPSPRAGRAHLYVTFGPDHVTDFDHIYGFVTVDYPAQPDAETDHRLIDERIRPALAAWFQRGYSFSYTPAQFAPTAHRYFRGEIRRIVLETV